MASESTRPAVEVNPYAAPQVGDPQEAFAEAGVGAWRDGDEIVIHERAELPRLCVKTGEPAAKQVWIKIVYRTPEGHWWKTSERQLAVPLAQTWRWLLIRAHRLSYVCYAPAMMGTLFATRGSVVPMLLVVLVGVLIMATSPLVEPLSFKTKGRYFWLRGAREPFLNRLPEWPYGK